MEDCVCLESTTGKGLFLQWSIFHSSLFFMAFAIPFSVFMIFGRLANCTLTLLSYFKFSSLGWEGSGPDLRGSWSWVQTRELLPRRGHQVKPAQERLGQGGAFENPLIVLLHLNMWKVLLRTGYCKKHTFSLRFTDFSTANTSILDIFNLCLFMHWNTSILQCLQKQTLKVSEKVLL